MESHHVGFLSSQNSIVQLLVIGCITLTFTLSLAEVLTPQDAKIILKQHNEYRKQESASDMYLMHWNVSLQQRANSWANRCLFKHERNLDIGENLYFDTDHDNGVYLRGLDSWHSEKSRWGYTDGSCTGACHFTQIVWAYTTTMGCSAHICPSLNVAGRTVHDALYLVCYYYPRGNFVGRFPYSRGRLCSECAEGDTCYGGLCVSSGPESKLAPDFVKMLLPLQPIRLSRPSSSLDAFKVLIQNFTSTSVQSPQSFRQRSFHHVRHQQTQHHHHTNIERVLTSSSATSSSSHSYSAKHAQVNQHITQGTHRQQQVIGLQHQPQVQRVRERHWLQQVGDDQRQREAEERRQQREEEERRRQREEDERRLLERQKQQEELERQQRLLEEKQRQQRKQEEEEKERRKQEILALRRQGEEEEKQRQQMEKLRKQQELEHQQRMKMYEQQRQQAEEQRRKEMEEQRRKEMEEQRKKEMGERQKSHHQQRYNIGRNDNQRKVSLTKDDDRDNHNNRKDLAIRWHGHSTIVIPRSRGDSEQTTESDTSRNVHLQRHRSQHGHSNVRYGSDRHNSGRQTQIGTPHVAGESTTAGYRDNGRYPGRNDVLHQKSTQDTLATTTSSTVGTVVRILSRGEIERLRDNKGLTTAATLYNPGRVHLSGTSARNQKKTYKVHSQEKSAPDDTERNENKLIGREKPDGDDNQESDDNSVNARRRNRQLERIKKIQKRWRKRYAEKVKSHPHMKKYVMGPDGRRCVDRLPDCEHWAAKCYRSAAVTLSCPLTCGKCGKNLGISQIQGDQPQRSSYNAYNLQQNPKGYHKMYKSLRRNRAHRRGLTREERRRRRLLRRLKKQNRAPSELRARAPAELRANAPSDSRANTPSEVRANAPSELRARPENRPEELRQERQRSKSHRRHGSSVDRERRRQARRRHRQTRPGFCRDDSRHTKSCKYWAKKGFCKDNRLIKKVYCRWSCASCG